MAAYPKANRPRRVTITALGVFLLGVWNGWRAVTLAQQNELLLGLALRPDPRVRLALALMWAVFFCTLAIGIVRRQRWTRPAGFVSILLYALYNLILLVGFVQSAVVRQAWPAWLLLYVAALLFVAWSFYGPGSGTYWQKPTRPGGPVD